MKLTILEYITPSRIGGAELYFLRLVKALRAAGHRVIVVTKQNSPIRNALAQTVADLHLWSTFGKADIVTLAKLFHLIRHEGVDLVHSHLSTASLLGSIAGRLAGVPVIARVPANEKKTFFQFAHYLTAVSHGVREHLIKQGIKADRVHVLYNGVDLIQYANPLPAREARKRLGLPQDAPTVAVVASLSRRKGHRFLLQALHQVSGRYRDVQAIFAGEGEQERSLCRLVDQLGLNGRVYFLGFCNDVFTVISACDVFVLPSLNEGLSNAVLEAMALKRPVITTAVSGMPEVVHDGETGLLVPPQDRSALAEALLRILGDSSFADKLAFQGRAFLEQHFDQNECLKRVDAFLQNVVTAWRSGHRLVT